MSSFTERIVERPTENSLLLDFCLCCCIIAIEFKLELYTLFQAVCFDQFFVTFVPAQIQGRVTDCCGIWLLKEYIKKQELNETGQINILSVDVIFFPHL